MSEMVRMSLLNMLKRDIRSLLPEMLLMGILIIMIFNIFLHVIIMKSTNVQKLILMIYLWE